MLHRMPQTAARLCVMRVSVGSSGVFLSDESLFPCDQFNFSAPLVHALQFRSSSCESLVGGCRFEFTKPNRLSAKQMQFNVDRMLFGLQGARSHVLVTRPTHTQTHKHALARMNMQRHFLFGLIRFTSAPAHTDTRATAHARINAHVHDTFTRTQTNKIILSNYRTKVLGLFYTAFTRL